MKAKHLIPLLALLFVCATAHGQRYLPRMGGITVTAGITEKTGFFVDAGYSTYTKRKHHWNFGVNYLQNTDRYYTQKLPLSELTAEGGFYLRLLQGPRRSFYLSVGLDGIVGYEWVNWSAHMDMLHPSSALPSARMVGLMHWLHIQAWASALPSDFDKAMREASTSRTATDTDSYAFFVKR